MSALRGHFQKHGPVQREQLPPPQHQQGFRPLS